MATMKDLALKIHQRTSRYTNLNQQIQDNAGNINTNLSKISTIEGQVEELQSKANALRGYKEYNSNEAYSVGDIIEAEGLFKVIKAITAEEEHPQLSDQEYFVNISELRNREELRTTIAEIDELRDMVRNIKFDAVELGGNSYPLVMKKSNLFFTMHTNYTTSYSPGSTPYLRYYFRIFTNKGMLVPKNPSQLGYLVMTADKSKYNTQTFSSLEDAKSKMDKTDILVAVNNPRPVYVNFGFDINNGFNVYMGGQSTSVSNFYYQMIDTKSDLEITRLEIVYYQHKTGFADITPKFKLVVSENANMSESKTAFDVTPALNTVYHYDNE